MNISVNKKTVSVCVASIGLSAALIISYFFNQKSDFLVGIFDSCNADLRALIEIYENEDKVASLVKDSVEAKNLFLSLDEEGCRDKKSTKKLYSELYQAVTKSSINALNVKKSGSIGKLTTSSRELKSDQKSSE